MADGRREVGESGLAVTMKTDGVFWKEEKVSKANDRTHKLSEVHVARVSLCCHPHGGRYGVQSKSNWG